MIQKKYGKKRKPGMMQGPGWGTQRPGGMKKAGKKSGAKKAASRKPSGKIGGR